jgi:hypothetical protein
MDVALDAGLGAASARELASPPYWLQQDRLSWTGGHGTDP